MKYNMDVIERYNHGELTNADSIHFPDSLKYKTLRKGRTVYGGGGIMPDYFIPLDTTRYTKFHRELTAKGAIVNADLKFIDKYRKKIRREYASFDKFKTRFETPQELIDLVLAEGEKAGVKPKDEEELQKDITGTETSDESLDCTGHLGYVGILRRHVRRESIREKKHWSSLSNNIQTTLYRSFTQTSFIVQNTP